MKVIIGGKSVHEPLKCPGVGRDAENVKSLVFYFNRAVTDDEMRFLHDVMQRAVCSVPLTGCGKPS